MSEPSSIQLGKLPAGTRIVFKQGMTFVAVEPNGALKMITPLGIMPLQFDTLSEEAKAAVQAAHTEAH